MYNLPDKIFSHGTFFMIYRAKSLTIESRYVALRLKMPKMVSSYINLLKRMLINFKLCQEELQKPISKNFKVMEEPYQTFIDSLVFMTDSDYLDSIGFDYSCIDNPDRLFDLLKSMKKLGNAKIEEKMPMHGKNC